MKKFLLLAAFLPLIFACKKDNQNNATGIPSLPATPKAEYAAKFDIPAESELSLHFRSIEFTAEGNYTLVRPVLDANGKPDGDKVIVDSGTYEVISKSGDPKTIYELKEINATCIVEPVSDPITKVTFGLNYIITIIFHGDSITITGTVTPSQGFESNALNKAICRVWEIASTDIGVNGNGITFGKIYEGCDLGAIAADLAEQKVGINPSKLAGRVVKTLEISDYKTLKVTFVNEVNHKDYYGTFSYFNDKGEFTYEVVNNGGANLLFTSNASGKIYFDKQVPYLTVKSSFKEESSGKTYNTTITFTLKY